MFNRNPRSTQEGSLLKRILYPSVGATTAMTLFSYFTAHLFRKQFREPVLLDYLFFHRYRPKAEHPPVRAWLLHYLIGVGFSGAYQLLWKKFFQLPATTDGLIYGTLCGALGVLGWQITLTAHPLPPTVERKPYFIHLLIAHLVFGITLSRIDRGIEASSSNPSRLPTTSRTEDQAEGRIPR